MISEGRPPLCNTSSEAGALESSIQKVRIENESDRKPRPTSDRRPTDLRPTSDRPPTNLRPTSDQPPTNLRPAFTYRRPTSDRPPTDLRPTSLVWAMTETPICVLASLNRSIRRNSLNLLKFVCSTLFR